MYEWPGRVLNMVMDTISFVQQGILTSRRFKTFGRIISLPHQQHFSRLHKVSGF